MLACGSRAESKPSCLTSHSDAHAHEVCVHKWESALSNPRKALWQRQPLAVTEHRKAQCSGRPDAKLSRISSTRSKHEETANGR